MLIISDNNTYLFEKIAKKNGINISEIINLSPEYENNFSKKSKDIIFLISELFYKKFKLKNFEFNDINEVMKNEFEMIDALINNLLQTGSIIYFPFIPKHFIYSDKYNSYFYEKNSYDILIENLNKRFYSPSLKMVILLFHHLNQKFHMYQQSYLVHLYQNHPIHNTQ